MTVVLVLNASYEPLQRVSVRHAIAMLVREVAVVEEVAEGRSMGPFPVPTVLRLVRYVHMRWRSRRVPAWSRQRLFLRDGQRCGYCGGRFAQLTVDHVIPRARGGRSTWSNTVSACGGPRGCNARKGSRTPTEARMPLLVELRVPSSWEFKPEGEVQ